MQFLNKTFVARVIFMNQVFGKVSIFLLLNYRFHNFEHIWRKNVNGRTPQNCFFYLIFVLLCLTGSSDKQPTLNLQVWIFFPQNLLFVLVCSKKSNANITVYFFFLKKSSFNCLNSSNSILIKKKSEFVVSGLDV